MITQEEYNTAKALTDSYERELRNQYDKRVLAFRTDLEAYFKENLIDGVFKLYEFELNRNEIIPTNPYMEEHYEGGNDADIEALCKKHDVKFSIVYWCYHK